MIAHAPIFSMVSSSGTHRSFWAMVPLALIAAEVSPIETPMAVTIPGQTRQSSMIGIKVSDEPPPSPSRSGFSGGVSPRSIAAATERSNSICFLNRSRAALSMPKVAKSLRSTSYGGVSPCSSSSTFGRISLSMN